MNEKDFFIGATLRICSSLEIEKALWKCLAYIRDYIPADYLHLTHHDLKNRVLKIIASTTVIEESISTIQIPMADDYFKWIESLQDAWIANDVETHYMMKHYLDYIDRKSSYLNVRLIVGDHFIGSLIIQAKGKNRFTEAHARLMSLLKEPFGIALANSLQHQELLKLRDQLKDENRHLQNELMRLSGYEIIGKNVGLKGVMESVNQVSNLTTPVLLIGDTGTGKEVIANAIHNLSPRKDGPFIKVNCGAIPETVIDSELFGHEKGAFTGAIAQKRGHFERAHEGTILLDEIGELPPEAQMRMLRVLQDKEIYRVGGSKPVKVDIRLIAATHRNLEDLIAKEKFRRDLYYRLRVFPIVVPPLKHRKGDIPGLVQHFIDKKSQEMGISQAVSLAPGALDCLLEYDWPGNVRELENAVERALIIRKGSVIDFPYITTVHLPDDIQQQKQSEEQLRPMDQILTEELKKVLTLTNGKVEGRNGAAEILKVKPNTLRSRMKKLGISFGHSYLHSR
ncbi:MAG: Fis family transcriptional regulator [Deltaproteobacteria bacterium HGW-Deltaproteobacteria-12]|jgi:transcriptional regulator with GAF, ATPase, and Fis domain|nr:MAG: Fis family transcriptional regulator [Deltaproteobacteria bacterium HGW-Deltaproteobacteria-12]